MKNKKIKKVTYIPWVGSPREDLVFSKYKVSWEYILKMQLKKQGIEIHTDDVLPIDKTDSCLIFDNMYYNNLEKIWKLYYAKLLHETTYIDYEPPTGHCKIHTNKGLKSLSKIFKHVITYNDDVIDGKRIIKGNIANYYSEPVKKQVDFDKKKFITMVTNYINVSQIIDMLNNFNNTAYYNKKNTKNHPNQLYSERKKAAQFFKNKCPNDFDLYGDNWSEEFSIVNRGPLEREKKLSILSNYKFIICYDSYKNQNGYISEKIFDAFNAKVVPIYYGASNINDYIPKECFIDRRNFQSYEDLYNYLKSMKQNEYEEKIKSIEKYLKSDLYNNYFSSEASAKIIEKCLLDEVNDFSYKKAYKELCKFENKRKKVQKRKKIDFYISNYLNNGDDIELTLLEFNHLVDNSIDYKVLINGVETKKNNIEIKEFVVRKEYKFSCSVKCISYPVKIEVTYDNNSKQRKALFNDYAPKYSEQVGLIVSKNKKSLYYFNLKKLSKTDKIKYSLFKTINNFKGVIKKIVYYFNIL